MRIEKKYWQFFWPLALLALAFQSGRLAQNFILLEMEGGVSKLATFSLALSIFMPFHAAMVFLPQAYTILVRDQKSFRAGIRFAAILITGLLAILSLFAYSPVGTWLLPKIYQIPGESMDTLLLYLRWFMPQLVFQGITAFIGGLFIQWHRTGAFTTVRVCEVSVLLGSLFLFVRWFEDPVLIIGLSRVLGWGASTILALLLFYRLRRPFKPSEEEAADPAGLPQFSKLFFPMAITSMMFALNRPILFYFVTRIPDITTAESDVIVSAITLGINFIMLFQSMGNQYRHVGAAFSKRDPQGSKRFLIQLTGLLVFLMAVAIISPFLQFFLVQMQNATGEVLAAATSAILVMAPTPFLIGFRNYFHGLAMVNRRTGIMGFAGLSRNLATLLCSMLLLQLGLLNVYTAAGIVITAFLAEAATVGIFGIKKLTSPK